MTASDAVRLRSRARRARAAQRGPALGRRARRAAVGRHPRLASCTAPRRRRTVALGETAPIQFDRHVGAAAPGRRRWLRAGRRPRLPVRRPRAPCAELAQPEAGRDDVRMNDGACDPQGRFWAGTMAYDESPGAGALYRLELDGTCTTVLTGLTISNGIGWSPDGRTMYLPTAAPPRSTRSTSTRAGGDLGRRRTIVQRHRARRRPDGLTVDDGGDLWVAIWDGGAVRRYAPDGTLRATVPLPSTVPPRARSVARTARRCSSPPPAMGSTRPPWPGSPTPDACSASTVSASPGRRATDTEGKPARDRAASSGRCRGRRLLGRDPSAERQRDQRDDGEHRER